MTAEQNLKTTTIVNPAKSNSAQHYDLVGEKEREIRHVLTSAYSRGAYTNREAQHCIPSCILYICATEINFT